MSLTTLDAVDLAKVQRVSLTAAIPNNSADARWYGSYQTSAGNTTTGAVPVAGDAGFPSITDDASASFYLSRVVARAGFGNGGQVDGTRVWLIDRLWHAGQISLNSLATTTFSSQPSFASRLPDGSYAGLVLAVEVLISTNAPCSVTIGCLNENGVSRSITVTTSNALRTEGFAWNIVPLQPGDRGVRRVDSFTVNTTQSGFANVVIYRPLKLLRAWPSYQDEVYALDRIGMPRIYGTSALDFIHAADSNPSGWVPDTEMEIDIVCG